MGAGKVWRDAEGRVWVPKRAKLLKNALYAVGSTLGTTFAPRVRRDVGIATTPFLLGLDGGRCEGAARAVSAMH